MKKILSLLFLSSSLFSMELDIVRYNTKVAAVKSMHKNMHIESHMELDTIRFNSKKMLIEQGSVFVPNRLGDIKLSHGKKGFCVEQNNKKHVIQKYFTDPMVRNVTKDQLKRFLEVGYLSLSQMDNGEFSLKANGRINGGGPILGAAAYWVTKSLCYAVGVTATVVTAGGAIAGAVALAPVAAPVIVGTGAVATGSVATVVAGAGTAIGTGAVITTTTGLVVATAATGGSVAGAAVAVGTAAAAISTTAGGAALGTAAVTTTAAVVSSAGGIGATIAGIEAVSVAVGTFFGMMPTP